MKYHYVYRITNIILGKHYYGVKTCKCDPHNHIGIKYFSTSKNKDFILDQKENPQDYKYKVIRIFKTRKEAIELEIKLHNKLDVGRNESFYNGAKQTSTGWDTTGMAEYFDEKGKSIFISVKEAKKRGLIAQSKGRKFSNETKIKMKNSQQNRLPVTEETKRKMSVWQKGKPKWDADGRNKLSKAHKGKTLSEEHKKNIGLRQLNIPKPKIKCPKCSFMCPAHLAKRWHFDNCRRDI